MRVVLPNKVNRYDAESAERFGMMNLRLLSVLAACVMICACSKPNQESSVVNDQETRPDQETSLVGDWETDLVLGQLGRTISRQTLRADGTFSASVEFPDMNALALEEFDMPMPAMTVEGTYSVEGDRITFTMPDNTTTSTFRFEGDTLVIEEDIGTDVFRYHRQKETG